MKLALAIIAPVASLAVGATLALTHHENAAPKSDLADRVNHACKPGYRVNDWTVGDSYDPVPAGTVKVTCVRATSPYDLYYAAVTR